MAESPLDSSAVAGEILPALPEAGARTVRPAPTEAGRTALERAQAFARQAAAPATLRAYYVRRAGLLSDSPAGMLDL
jgi:hypothetical protein